MAKYLFGDLVKEVKEKVDRQNNPYEYYIAGDHMDTDELHLLRRGTFEGSDVGPAFIRVFKPGQVLYGSRRTYLRKVAVADFEGITANTTFVLESKDESVLLQRLLPFVMQSERFTQHSIKRSKGSTNPYVLFSDLCDYEVDLPDVEEQKQLTDILWAMDAVRMSYKRLIEASDNLVKSQFIEIFGSDSLEGLSCPTATMGEVFDITSSKRILKSEWRSEGIPFLRVRDMVILAMNRPADNEFFVSEDFFNRLKDSDGLPCSGDIMVSATSTIGKCYEVATNDRFYYKDADILRFRKKRDVDANFFMYCMKLPVLMKQIEATLGVTTVGHFLIARAKKIQMPLPPIELQQQFAAFVRQSDKSKFAALIASNLNL